MKNNEENITILEELAKVYGVALPKGVSTKVFYLDEGEAKKYEKISVNIKPFYNLKQFNLYFFVLFEIIKIIIICLNYSIL